MIEVHMKIRTFRIVSSTLSLYAAQRLSAVWIFVYNEY